MSKAEKLRRLHMDEDLLILVNVWDVASARAAATVTGCQALATASAAIADVHGYEDGEHIPFPLMMSVVERICRASDLPVSADGVPIVINARTDTHLIDTGLTAEARLAEAVSRGKAYLDAGADCVFVPGCTSASEIAELVAAFGKGKLSLLAVPGIPGNTELEKLGVARLSYGPYAHRHSLEAFTEFVSTAQRRGR